MTLLLDTHAFLWWRLNDARIAGARDAISNAPEVFVSVASAWEASVKIGLGKLTLDERFEEMIAGSRFSPLPIAFAHTERVVGLPRHHKDPFDRMLVAQALEENLTLVTHDRRLALYGARTQLI
jgi:PIN domain nuclease of toxin-antitoxin system